MATPAHNVAPPPIDKILPPPREFGKDGGKFYRCYDNMAEEVDEDLTKGLKEQLDGLLTFAGLFAGVNSAFLSLTLPLLSADPADDTNALLAQNNAILLQLALGRNDSLPTNSVVPSATFSPSARVVAVNVLFSLSLTFALVSSFVAVLGRQWLIHYRKRSGAGPDRQRWEQLRRFLGAKVWSLELILDDLLPLLLQAGLVIFCVAFVVYLQVLNFKVSRFVAITLYISLAAFVCSAVGAALDPFCPFQSPLSHFLSCLVSRTTSLARQLVRDPEINRLLRGLRWPRSLPEVIASILYLQAVAPTIPDLRRLYLESHAIQFEETYNTIREYLEGREPVLQVIAAKRVACTSDDPETLLITMTNLFTISDRRSLQQLWTDRSCRDRLLELCKTAYDRTLEWQGRDKIELAKASALFYRTCLTHILLSARSYYDFTIEQDLRTICRRDHAIADTRWLSGQSITEFPPALIDASLSWWLIQSFVNSTSWSWIIARVINYSDALSQPRWSLLSLIINAVITEDRYYDDRVEPRDALLLVREAYSGNVKKTVKGLEKAIHILSPRSIQGLEPLRRAHLLGSILECATKLIASAEAGVNVGSDERLTFFRVMEMYLRKARQDREDEGDDNEEDEEAREIIERIIPLWQSSRAVLVSELQAQIVDASEYICREVVRRVRQLLEDAQGLGVKDYMYNENRTLLDSLDPLIRHLEDRFLHADSPPAAGGETVEMIVQLRQFFNNFNSDVKKVSKRVSQRAISQAPNHEAAQPSAPQNAQLRSVLDRVDTTATRS